MNISVSSQMMEFLYSALLGVGIGIFYDMIAVLRSYLPNKKIITILFDLLFWIIAIIALFAFVMIYTDGQMRWYFLLGIFFGIFLYKSTISALFFRAIRIIISIVVKVLNLLCRPLYWMASKSYHAMRGVKIKLYKSKLKRRKARHGKQKEKT